MALKRSGIILEMQNFATYKKQAAEIERIHKKTFDQSVVKGFDNASRQFNQSSSRMQQSSKSTWQVVTNLREAFNNASGAAVNSGSKFSLVGGLVDKLRGGFSGVVGGLGGFQGGLLGVLGPLGKFATLLKVAMDIVNFVKASGEVAQSAETMRVSLEEVGQATGYSIQQIDLATNLLKDQGITTTAAQKSLLKMARANISWAEASKLAKIAQGSAVIAGMNSSEAFERLVTGIQKMEPELLDELGITLQREVAYKKFAQTMGLNAQALTNQQKQQAILNSIYEQSTVVEGVYDAAMETTGKQQASLARHIEETQLSLGKLVLPFKAVSVTMQTSFWKGLRTITKGLESFVPIVDFIAKDTIPKLAEAWFGSAEQHEKIFAHMGEGGHRWAQVTAQTMAFIRATIRTTLMWVGEQLIRLDEFEKKIKDWDIKGAVSGIAKAPDMTLFSEEGRDNIWDTFQESFDDSYQNIMDKFPNLFKSWEELNKEVEGDSEDLRLPSEDIAESSEQSQEAIEALIEVYQRLDDIHRKFNEDVKSLEKDTAKEVAKAQDDLAKSIQKAEDNRAKSLKELEKNLAKDKEKILKEHSKRVIQEEKRRNRELEFEQKRFQLSMLQAQRRFQLDDRRLRAEGDILGLQELRENFELEQTEAKENFGLQQEEAKAKADEEDSQRQEELQDQLDALEERAEEERQRIQDSYKQEMADLQEANTTKMEEIQKSFEERFNALVEGRQKELEELGRSLQDEGQITEEGMQQIADHIGGVFGPGGESDSFIKGWASRTESEFGKLIQELKKEIKELEGAAQSAANTANRASQSLSGGGSSGGPFGGGGGGGIPGMPQQIPMQHGGSGVVTGPAHFFVEPGVKEHVAFTPLGAGRNQMQHSGNLSHSINVAGLSDGLNEQMTQAIINKAADQVVEDIIITVEKLKKRNG